MTWLQASCFGIILASFIHACGTALARIDYTSSFADVWFDWRVAILAWIVLSVTFTMVFRSL